MKDLNTLIGRMFKQLTATTKSPHRSITTFLGQYDDLILYTDGFTFSVSKGIGEDIYWADPDDPFDEDSDGNWDLFYWA